MWICDLKDNHKGYRNVLYANLRAETLSEEEFQGLLNKPENKAFAEALRKAESE